MLQLLAGSASRNRLPPRYGTPLTPLPETTPAVNQAPPSSMILECQFRGQFGILPSLSPPALSPEEFGEFGEFSSLLINREQGYGRHGLSSHWE